MSISMKALTTTVALAMTAGTILVGSYGHAESGANAPAGSKPVKPSIVLAHGAFADGSSWDRVIPLLQARGYNVVAVHQPLTSLADDVAATRRVLDDQPGDVILVGHSYGGVVITEAGNHAKVVGMVYIAAFAPDGGESVNDLGKGQPAPAWLGTVKVDGGGFVWLPEETVVKDFAQDLPKAQAKVVAAKQGRIAARCNDDKVTTAAWKNKPTWYVRATQDHIIDPSAQALMAKRMGSTVTSIKASHVVMMSKPREVSDVILTAAAVAVRK